MSDYEIPQLETLIQASYQRLRKGNIVYLLRNRYIAYGELPDPTDTVKIYKASVFKVQGNEFTSGVDIIDWPNFNQKPETQSEDLSYNISPRELFLTREMLAILRERTALPMPRPSKLNQRLESKSGRFSAILASEMAKVVLERFNYDPRGLDGRLIQKR